MPIDGYTNLQGTIEIDDVVFAVAEFEMNITREVLEHARMGNYSKLKLPGGIDFTGTMSRIQIDGRFVGYALGDTETSGSAVALHAGLTPTTGVGTESITDMTDPASLSSLIKFTALTAAITTAGTAVIIGTGVNDAALTEIVTLTTLGINETVTGTKIFKTVEQVVLKDMAQVGGTLKVDAVAGAANIVVGDAKIFKIQGKVLNGSDNITMVITNCYLTKGMFAVADAAITSDDLEFTCKKPDTDIILTYNAT
ncbi:MAG: hypothetical protein KAJ03_01660 [Gammaproteobacteria bacterium]|nr:hypothetical protein [Gammaproteobacteria bacterium]